MSKPRLVTASNGTGIQALSMGTVANAAVGGSSTATAIPSGSVIVEVSASTDCYILFGDSGATVSASTGAFFPKGVAVYRVEDEQTHIAHIQSAAAGRITITQLQ